MNGCDSIININVSFINTVTGNLVDVICPSESVVINNVTFDFNNPSGSVLIPNGSYLGCDSLVNVNLFFHDEAINEITDQLCTGSNITVNGTVYDETNPSGTEVIANGSANGCDSTIVVDLSFSSEVFETVDPTLCSGESVTINGVVYDENMPAGTETFPEAASLAATRR